MARDRASRPQAAPYRLFVAVDVPAEVKRELEEALEPLRPRVPGARWTNAEGWHVTLKFLGATWPRLVEWVRESVAGVGERCPPFVTALTVLGVFPGPTRARVVWAGLEDSEGRFAEVVKLLDDALGEHFPAEKRAFTPHLTLARLNPPRDLRQSAPDLAGTSVASASFMVEELVLYRSHLSPRGARYEPLARLPLGAS